MRARSLFISMAVLATACSLPFLSGNWKRDLGYIGVDFVPVIVAPDTVTVGVPFQVTVNTFGSGSCSRADGADVASQPSLITITVYDRYRTEGACTADLSSHGRTVTAAFTAAGTGTLRASGTVSDSTGRRVPGIRERSVVVRP
jgi:hypothetical protein